MQTFKSVALLFASAAAATAQTNTFPASGNVGLGTTTPDKPLHIFYDSSTVPAVKIGSGTDAQGWYTFIGNDPAGATTSFIGNAYNNDAATFQIRMKSPLPGSARLTVLGGGNVGIGTSNPGSKLSIVGNVMVQGADGWNANGNLAKLTFGTAVYGADVTGVCAKFGAGLYFGVYQNGASGVLSSNSLDAMVIQQTTGNVGIGTTSPTQKLSVNGTVRAKEVIVETGWSDFVFEHDYALAPLNEVEQYVKAEKHLPGIPTAQEVAEKGISLGEMQAKLLGKIEELTLHVIAQEKRLAAQDAKIETQDAEIARLKGAKP